MQFQPIHALPFPLLAGFSDGRLCALEYTPDLPETYAPVTGENYDVCRRLEAELAEYAAGKRKEFTIPLQPSGSDFSRLVWRELQKVPYGEVRSYGEIAACITAGSGRSSALYSRAVGNACGKNAILILIPCHRIIAKNGIGGFSCGLAVKKALWDIEGIRLP
ncbi:MAG: methylated-DNA--[Clostridia bacterium]|nr:methylated-DNA--[protein]-cysteine S-methyltransferase [Clostridia bacterium]